MRSDLDIVVPVFNESENIAPLTEEITRAFNGRAERIRILYVDDASTDDTWAVIERLQQANPCIIGIRHARNAGQSAALWTGIRQSNAPLIATLDGDLQNDPADLPRLLDALSDADFVCGHRVNRRDTWVRRVSSRVAFRARRMVFGAGFQDTGCALRVFRRTAIEGLLPFNGWHRFLPVLVQRTGARTMEIPVNHRPRHAGASKYGVGNRLARGIYDLIGVSWYLKRRLPETPVVEGAKGQEGGAQRGKG